MIKNIKLKDLVPNDGQIEGLPANPRFIRDNRFEALCKSLREDPEMLNWRPLLVYPLDGKYVILAGNMRHRALISLGHSTTVPCELLPAETPIEKLKKYTIVDNIGFGDWDHDMLSNEWDADEILDLGMEMPWLEDKVETYAMKNQEVDTGEFANEMTFTLKYSEQDYFKVKAKLQELAPSPELAVWKLCGYE